MPSDLRFTYTREMTQSFRTWIASRGWSEVSLRSELASSQVTVVWSLSAYK